MGLGLEGGVDLPPLLTQSIQSLVLNLGQYFFTRNNLFVLRDLFLVPWIINR